MEELTELTVEQTAMLKVFETEWLKIGLTTEAMDTKIVEHWIRKSYVAAGIPEPQEVIFVKGGPMSLLDKYIEILGPDAGMPDDEDEKKSRRKELWNELSNCLCYGVHDASWLGFYEYFMSGASLPVRKNAETPEEAYPNKPLVEDLGRVFPLTQLARAGCGWYAPFETVCIVSEPPLQICLKTPTQLHNEHGPAICYADGRASVWRLNGVAVPSWLVTTEAHKLDPKEMLKITNAEVRREFVRKVGIDRVCYCLNAEVVDKEGDYELLLLDIGDGNKRPYLKMLNPSVPGVWHVEGVEVGITTVKEANAWRRGGLPEPEALT